MTKFVQGEALTTLATDPHNGVTPSTFPYARFSFYRPHSRALTAYTGTLVNPLTGEVTSPPSRTKQEFKDQCDINNIIKSFKLTGQIQHINAKAQQGRFEDLPDELDFQQSQNTIRQASLAFESLPARLRDRFGNDPTAFLAFLADPANKDEATRLGLIKKTETPPAPDTGGGKQPPAAPPAEQVSAPADAPKK